MKILIHYTLPGGEKISNADRRNAVVPSFFIREVLPQLMSLLPDASFALVQDIAPDTPQAVAGGDDDAVEVPAGMPARLRIFLREGRGRGTLANWWWKKFRLPGIIREFGPQAIIYVNHATIIGNKSRFAGLARQVIFFEDADLVAAKTLASVGKEAAVFIAGSPYAASKLASDAGLGETAVVALRRPAMTSYKPQSGSGQTGALSTAVADDGIVAADGSTDPSQPVTGGKTYFIVGGQLNAGLMEVIRAFSVFKKRQKSDWKLLLAGTGRADKKFMASLAHYQYRADLVVIDPVAPDQLPSLLAGAYALVYSGSQHPRLLPEAFAAGVPVIAPRLPWFESGWSDALLLYEAGSQVAVAEEMMTIYKDEKLRSALVSRGRALESEWSWQKMAGAIAAALTR